MDYSTTEFSSIVSINLEEEYIEKNSDGESIPLKGKETVLCFQYKESFKLHDKEDDVENVSLTVQGCGISNCAPALPENVKVPLNCISSEITSVVLLDTENAKGTGQVYVSDTLRGNVQNICGVNEEKVSSNYDNSEFSSVVVIDGETVTVSDYALVASLESSGRKDKVKSERTKSVERHSNTELDGSRENLIGQETSRRKDKVKSERTKSVECHSNTELNGSRENLIGQEANIDKSKISKSAQRKCNRKCAVLNCTYDGKGSLFSFPSVELSKEESIIRCLNWVKSSGNAQLLQCPLPKLFKKFFVCAQHFSDDSFYNVKRNRLRPGVVPTVHLPCILDIPEEYVPRVPIQVYGVETDVCVEEDMDIAVENGENAVVCGLDDFQKKFQEEMLGLRWYYCDSCKEKFISKKILRKSCLHNNSCKDYSEVNDMDPGIVPDVLQELTYVEQLLIAKVHVILSVYKVRGHQYKYSGNVINFPQDVSQFAKTLPYKLTELTTVLAVKTRSDIKPADFNVRSQKIKDALLWLKGNNMYYQDIEISEENLSLLPEDGNVFSELNTMNVNDSNEDDDEVNSNEETDEEQPNVTIQSGVPTAVIPSQDEQISNAVHWPPINSTPVNEFDTVGYVAQAFPCLYPTGKADLRAPREKSISPAAYFKHMLHYHDQRFAKHPQYRFFALNSLMRWNAMTDGNLFVKKNEELKSITVNELREKLKENPQYLRKVMFHCSNLKGTKPYWRVRSNELLNMIEQLGMPTLFLTLSAADLHWYELFKILCPDVDPETLTDGMRRTLVQENPLIVDKFFSERVESFFKSVLVPKYKVKDHWYRFEYQHRGSPHIHGVLWLEDAPDVTNLKEMTPEECEAIVQYFDTLISTFHPNLNAFPAAVHPCQIQLRNVINFEQDLAELLNKVQRHTVCTERYCLRLNKTTKKRECRFKFPQNLCESSSICIDNNEVKFTSRRNDPLLNKYNAYILQSWRANMDVSPVLSKEALVNYLAKYISKAETKSKQLADILKEIFDNTDECKLSKSVIQKLYIQACSERDYSAQEVCHLVMGDKLYCAGGRKFISLNFNTLDEWVKVSDDRINGRYKSIFEKYMERSEEFNEKSLWYMAKNYVMPSERKQTKSNIVQVFPNLKYLEEKDKEKFCRIQTMLHVPWKNISDFDTENLTWVEIYEENKEKIAIESNICSLNISDRTENEQESDTEDFESEETEEGEEEWMLISRMGPNQETDKIEIGRREIDINHDWNSSLYKYCPQENVEFLVNFIRDNKKNSNTDKENVIDVGNVTFTDEQQRLIDLVKLQLAFLKNGSTCSTSNFLLPRKIIVQGKAGTGKSLLIHTISGMIQRELGNEAVLILAPTGVAAVNINGATIHSQLRISRDEKDFALLSGPALKSLQEFFMNKKFLILDEYSFIGAGLLGMIDSRCRQGTGNLKEPFGGLFVYLCGDIKQLPPVLDTPLYSTKVPSLKIRLQGLKAFKEFDASVVLTKVQRQEDETLKNVLDHISEGKFSLNDYNILKTRFVTNVSPEEKKLFSNAFEVYPTRKKVLERNLECIEKLRNPDTNSPVPIALIKAKTNCLEAEKASSDEACGLFQKLHLGKGMKVMLRSNLWTKSGLVNGSVGTVVDIIYEREMRPPNDRPVVVICSFPSFKGPYLNNIPHVVPIPAITGSWLSKSGQSCSRTQFPIVPAYASTIHKCQGLTLSQIKADIGERENQIGLSYVALTRVKDLKSMLLMPFPFKRLESLNHSEPFLNKLKVEENLFKKQLQFGSNYS